MSEISQRLKESADVLERATNCKGLDKDSVTMLKEYKSEIVELIHLNNHLVGQLSNAQDDIERHNKKSEIKFVETQSIEKIRLAMVCLKNETSS